MRCPDSRRLRRSGMHTFLALGLLGCSTGLALNTAALVPSPSGARPELLRRFSATTYQEVVRPARKSIPGLFSYVNCRPFNELTTEGRFFLATNLAFALTGGAMAMQGGSPALGVCFELAGTCGARASNRSAAARTFTLKPNLRPRTCAQVLDLLPLGAAQAGWHVASVRAARPAVRLYGRVPYPRRRPGLRGGRRQLRRTPAARRRRVRHRCRRRLRRRLLAGVPQAEAIHARPRAVARAGGGGRFLSGYRCRRCEVTRNKSINTHVVDGREVCGV